MKEKEYKFPICPECGSKTVQFRIKTMDYWCRRCGHIGIRKEFFKNEFRKNREKNQ